jgi:hypothetical protein
MDRRNRSSRRTYVKSKPIDVLFFVDPFAIFIIIIHIVTQYLYMVLLMNDTQETHVEKMSVSCLPGIV